MNGLMVKIRLVLHLIVNIFLGKKKKALIALCENQELLSIPIFIVNYNRLSYVSQLVTRLRKDGFRKIYIIDNCSSYPPLLDYYRIVDCEVIRLDYNGGARVFWEDKRFKKYRDGFYIVTDPDIYPIEECTANYVEQFIQLLCKYPFVKKVGFSLKLDDIPSDVTLFNEIIGFEKFYYNTKLKRDNIYYAPIDTTFAVYSPDSIAENIPFYRAFRTGYPLQARHLPWYKKSDDITEEDQYYAEHKTNGWWDFVKGEVTPD